MDTALLDTTTIVAGPCNNTVHNLQLAALGFFVLISIVSEVLAFVPETKVQAKSVLQLLFNFIKTIAVVLDLIQPIKLTRTNV